ncbi:hypothetical protein L1049_010051 [Liquidambar formosana]|uniref:Uncharacterized protein n=1 Tax=Liquidambar formosana TaxID=63359 RepID=A0AAP0N9I9_LIQFO
MAKERSSLKKLYEEMKKRIETTAKLGQISEDKRKEHKGFHEWDLVSNRHDHQAIVQIRVSSRISNGSIILNVDCDMYSNNSESVRDALCFLMDEEKGHEIAYVQYPQKFNNLTKNDIYGTSFRVIQKMRDDGRDVREERRAETIIARENSGRKVIVIGGASVEQC